MDTISAMASSTYCTYMVYPFDLLQKSSLSKENVFVDFVQKNIKIFLNPLLFSSRNKGSDAPPLLVIRGFLAGLLACFFLTAFP